MTAARRAVGGLAVVLFAWWATADGGYAPGAWYPGALLMLAALVAVVRPRMWLDVPRPARWALAALAAYTLWSFCSIAWADARGDAWDGANRTLLYLTVFALFAALPWRTGEAAAGLGAFAVATAGLGCWAVLLDDGAFVDGRLAAPVGYENASAALFLCAFWAALVLAARRETPAHWRAVLLATAGLAIQLTLLAQSRGSLVAGFVTLGVAVVLVRDRLPLVLGLGAVAAVGAASLPALLGVYEEEGASGAVTAAAVAMGLSAAALLAVGAGLGRLERRTARWRVPRPRTTVAVLGGLAALAGVVLALAGGPFAAPGGAADSRFTAGPGSGRYDFWRVAALEFARNPIGGVGADNFAHDYVRDRRHGEEPLYPHSLALRAFSQTGIVGGGLLLAFLGAVIAAVWRSRAPVAVAAFVAASVWIVHGSLDWLWETPAVAAPAFACLGLATAGRGGRPATMAGGHRRAATAAFAALALAAAASYALPALAARDVEAAAAAFDTDPAGALDTLGRASDLNPLSDRPDRVAGALARGAGDRATARAAFARALARDDRNWHAHVELALLDLEAGRRAAALARLARARDLNPGEETVGWALTVARAGGPVPGALLEELAEDAVPGPIGPHPVDCRPVLGIGC
jgi:hypothetical protein